MNKLKFLTKGSLKEYEFLSKMLQEGYYLENLKGLLYQFKSKVDPNENYLVVEFSQSTDKRLTPDLKEELGIKHDYCKKLLLTDYVLNYQYSDQDWGAGKENEIQLKLELEYSKQFGNRMGNIRVAMIVLIVLIFSYLFFIASFNSFSFLLISLFILEITSLIVWRKNRKREKPLEKKLGDYTVDWKPTWIVTIENSQEEIDIKQFSYLGKWHLASHSKNNYYYQLQTLCSETEIKSNLASVLGIDINQIKMVSNLGLFPIGF